MLGFRVVATCAPAERQCRVSAEADVQHGNRERRQSVWRWHMSTSTGTASCARPPRR